MNHRVVKRYVQSIFWYWVVLVFNAIKKRDHLSQLVRIKSKEVHISCPGPSAQMIESCCLDEGTPVIFVNHAVSLVDSIVFSRARKFFLSADAVRVAEVMRLKPEYLHKCTSVLVPGHVFQISWGILRSIDYVIAPQCYFSANYGLVIQERETHDIQAMTDRPVCYGFGSLLMAISFALTFRPSVIHIWGSDFQTVNGAAYFSNDFPERELPPFELLRRTITIAVNQLQAQGIEIRIHRGTQDE